MKNTKIFLTIASSLCALLLCSSCENSEKKRHKFTRDSISNSKEYLDSISRKKEAERLEQIRLDSLEDASMLVIIFDKDSTYHYYLPCKSYTNYVYGFEADHKIMPSTEHFSLVKRTYAKEHGYRPCIFCNDMIDKDDALEYVKEIYDLDEIRDFYYDDDRPDYDPSW